MLAWIHRYASAIILSLALLALLDATISSLVTCHPPAEQAPEQCSALQGPLLRSLIWLADIGRKYEGLITAIFTVVLAGFTAALWRSTDKLWQAAAAQETARAAETRILQRAYVAVEPMGIHMMLGRDKLIGHVFMTNAGNLPAKRVAWVIDIKFSQNDKETDFPIGELKGNVVIVPSAHAPRGSGSSVRIKDLQRIAGVSMSANADENDIFLYVWGALTYDDGFGSIRTTKFCHRYNWKMRGRETETYEIATQHARYHEHGNDAD
jgi:hypothetical protein